MELRKIYSYINSFLGNNPLILSDKNNKVIEFLVKNCDFVIRKGKEEGRLYFHIKYRTKLSGSVEIKFYDIDALWDFALRPNLGYVIPGYEGCELCRKSVFGDCKCDVC